MSTQSFPTTFGLDEFSEKNTTVVPDQFTIVYQDEVPKGEAVGFGRGQMATQTDAEGRLFAQFTESGAGAGTAGTVIESGTVRLTVRTRQGRLVSVINEYDVSEIQSGEAAADRTNRMPFPIQRFAANGRTNRWIAYPYTVCLEFRLGSAVDIDTAASAFKADGKRAEKTS